MVGNVCWEESNELIGDFEAELQILRLTTPELRPQKANIALWGPHEENVRGSFAQDDSLLEED